MTRAEQFAAMDILYQETCLLLNFFQNRFSIKYHHFNNHLLQFALVFGPTIDFSSSCLEGLIGIFKRTVERQTNKNLRCSQEEESTTQKSPSNMLESALCRLEALDIEEAKKTLSKIPTTPDKRRGFQLRESGKIIASTEEEFETLLKIKEFLDNNSKMSTTETPNTPRTTRRQNLHPFTKATGISIVEGGSCFEEMHKHKSGSSQRDSRQFTVDTFQHSNGEEIFFVPPYEELALRRDFISKTHSKKFFDILIRPMKTAKEKVKDLEEMLKEDLEKEKSMVVEINDLILSMDD